MENLPEVITELDAKYAQARAAFERRDLAAYMSLFSSELRYRQSNGKVINRARLGEDVQAQFQHLTRVQSYDVRRERIELDGDKVIVTLCLIACVSTSAFFIVHRTWNLYRKGRYVWRKTEDGWQIDEVDILEETVNPGRFHFGFRVPALDS
jgi:hypothetical protein